VEAFCECELVTFFWFLAASLFFAQTAVTKIVLDEHRVADASEHKNEKRSISARNMRSSQTHTFTGCETCTYVKAHRL